jgi:hypothetical protein
MTSGPPSSDWHDWGNSGAGGAFVVVVRSTFYRTGLKGSPPPLPSPSYPPAPPPQEAMSARGALKQSWQYVHAHKGPAEDKERKEMAIRTGRLLDAARTHELAPPPVPNTV